MIAYNRNKAKEKVREIIKARGISYEEQMGFSIIRLDALEYQDEGEWLNYEVREYLKGTK